MRRFASRTPVLATLAAILLLVAGLLSAIASERDFRQQKVEQAQAHARVLAASVGAALAFNDPLEAMRAVDALAVNPDIDAVGVYDADGRLFVERTGASRPPPSRLEHGFNSRFYVANHAVASAPVLQSETVLGGVYVRLAAGSGVGRWIRYIGIGLLLVMAALMMVVIAAVQGELSKANTELSRRAEDLAAINTRLSGEMHERRKAESALAQAQKMEAIGQLTGGVAHDFNNLLMVISSGLRLLETREDAAKRASIVESMRQAVERGAGLTKQLLAFSRRQKLAPEVIVVADRLQALRPLIERSLREDIRMEFDFGDHGAAVKVDPGQFDLAILNLAVNARDAMPRGGNLTLRVRRQREGQREEAAISVIDTGMGMPPEVVARAFDPFFTTKEVGRGTGLGLSQVYGFALQSGGHCEIESEPDRFTNVTLTLPCSNEAPPRAVAKAPVGDVTGAGKVLVVEDDDNVAVVVCDMIADLGYTPIRVATAQQALTHLEAGGDEPDLVFSDIIMPGGLSGVDLARELRRRRPDLPVLLTTGYGGRNEPDVRGFTVLRKPYDRDALGAALAGARSG